MYGDRLLLWIRTIASKNFEFLGESPEKVLFESEIRRNVYILSFNLQESVGRGRQGVSFLQICRCTLPAIGHHLHIVLSLLENY